MSIIEKLQHKRILIWGYGREGKSTKRFLERYCPDAEADVLEGAREDVKEENYDYIIKSPGIACLHQGEKFTSQTELFLEEFGKQVIGVTGTKGKSTTSTLLYETLKACSGRHVVLVGNIGLPCLDFYEEITPDTIIVFELSCHQLADCRVSPHIGVFLNLYEEHLDYYKVMEEYFRAKNNVAANQKPGDVCYIGAQVPHFETKGEKHIIDAANVGEYHLQIPGAHNNYNAEFVCQIATKQFSCDVRKVEEAMQAFTGLPHRLQKVATRDGITFYDDSISTIPEAAIAAVRSLPDVKTVILGGMDRHIEYAGLEAFIREREEIRFILAYETGERIYKELGQTKNCSLAKDLQEAVEIARRITPKGAGCVLSPAAASYGYFKNFEERGEYFQKYVTE